VLAVRYRRSTRPVSTEWLATPVGTRVLVWATGAQRIMTAKAKRLPPNLQVWVDARKRYRLSHAHVQMARELGLNPRKFGKLGQHRQEPWKAPLPQFIEHIYAKRFGRERPEVVVSVEEHARQLERKKAARKAAKAARAERAAQAPADAAAE
jgi:hypothetical protein